MDQEHLFWITISSYYYLYIVYSILVDKRLFREIQDTDLHLMYKYFSSRETSAFMRGFMKCLFYFALPVYLFFKSYTLLSSEG